MPTYHHMTIDGWVEGDERPSVAAATFERTKTDGLNAVPLINYTLFWKSPAVSVSELEAMLDAHGLLEMNVSAEFAEVSWDMSWAM